MLGDTVDIRQSPASSAWSKVFCYKYTSCAQGLSDCLLKGELASFFSQNCNHATQHCQEQKAYHFLYDFSLVLFFCP